MDNKQIEEAVAYFRYEHLPQEILLKAKPLFELAHLFLSVKGAPKKKECYIVSAAEGFSHLGIIPLTCHKCFNCGYNLCHDEFTAWLAGRMEGIRNILAQPPDRISNITIEDYEQVRQKILELINGKN